MVRLLGVYIGVFFFTHHLFAINNDPELDSLIQLALKNNKGLKAEQLQLRKYNTGINAAFDFEKTRVYYAYDQNNIASNDHPLHIIGAEQNFDFPSIYLAQRELNRAAFNVQESSLRLSENMIMLNVSKLYQQVVFSQHKEKLYIYLDSLFSHLPYSSVNKVQNEEMEYLQKIMTEAECRKIRTILNQVREEKQIAYSKLLTVLQVDTIVIKVGKMWQLKMEEGGNQRLYTDLHARNTQVLRRSFRLERMRWLPGLNLHVFSGTNEGLGYWMNAVELGLTVPLFFSGNVAKAKMARLELISWEQARQNEEVKMTNFIVQKQDELDLHQEGISYYEKYGDDLSAEIIRTAQQGFERGSLDFFQYIQSVKNSVELEIDYLSNLLQYNQVYLDLYYFNYLEQ